MTTSFPFLKIARDHNLPYGAVVRIAEAIPMLVKGRECDLDHQTGADLDQYRHPILLSDIAIAVVEERERRKVITHGLAAVL